VSVRFATTTAERRFAAGLALLVLPAVLIAVVVAGSIGHAFAIEFSGNLWLPGHAILNGRSPYSAANLDHVAQLVAAGRPPANFQTDVFGAYPAPMLLLGVPFALLPFAIARWIWFALCLGCPALALRLLGVRDRRVYGVTYLSIAVISGAMLGSVTLPLLVGLAALWRYRDDWRGSAALVAAVVCAKLFLWPLLVWLLVTRRFHAAAAATAAAAVGCIVGWAAIGFAGATSYPHLLRTLSRIEEGRGYSIVRGGLALHLSTTESTVVALAVGAVLLGWCTRLALRGGRGADAQTFTLAVIAALALSPIVWEQYFALLVVPIALVQDRLGPLWFAPLLFWIAPYNATEGHPERLLLAGAVLMAIGAATFRARRARPESVAA
jgi:hypothetical protein